MTTGATNDFSDEIYVDAERLRRETAPFDAGLVSLEIFVDEDIYKQELGQVFARCWLYLGHESQLRRPGQFLTTLMGEDQMLVVADSSGRPRAFHNSCPFAGGLIARHDEGVTESFECSCHGWSWTIDGQLAGRPDVSLIAIEQLDTYKGLIFGCWDKAAPPLREYLGEAAFYLDILLDRREGGTEIIGGAQKWTVDCNWKFAAENFAGDLYHEETAHGSALRAGFRTFHTIGDSLHVTTGGGHGFQIGMFPEDAADPFELEWYPEPLQSYYRDTAAEMERRLGEAPAHRLRVNGHGNIFPNLSIIFTLPSLRVWHPKGPNQIEVWSWCLVERDAPVEVKQFIARQYSRYFGPNGVLETDDVENWEGATAASMGLIARRHPFNVQMGLGHERLSEEFPGLIGGMYSESNQRAFYQWWRRVVAGETWRALAPGLNPYNRI